MNGFLKEGNREANIFYCASFKKETKGGFFTPCTGCKSLYFQECTPNSGVFATIIRVEMGGHLFIHFLFQQIRRIDAKLFFKGLRKILRISIAHHLGNLGNVGYIIFQ